jgi:flavin reductase (DIM6/NTAB) family NADH-FMN oxidoreductase RutF
MTTPATEAVLAAVMDELPYGLYILGTQAPDGEPNGMMADWLTQVSLRPRLVAVAIENTAHTLANLRQVPAFSINVLGQDRAGMELARRFAQPYADSKIGGRSHLAGVDVHRKLEGISYVRTAQGCPVLADAIAWLACTVQQFVGAGDHTLVLGAVLTGGLVRAAEPLTSTYTGWSYSG